MLHMLYDRCIRAADLYRVWAVGWLVGLLMCGGGRTARMLTTPSCSCQSCLCGERQPGMGEQAHVLSASAVHHQ